MSDDNVKKVSSKAIQGKQKTTCNSHPEVNGISEYKRDQKKTQMEGTKGFTFNTQAQVIERGKEARKEVEG
jgi:hypothetical protein